MAALAAERNMNDVPQGDQNMHPFFVRRASKYSGFAQLLYSQNQGVAGVIVLTSRCRIS